MPKVLDFYPDEGLAPQRPSKERRKETVLPFKRRFMYYG